MATIGFKWSGIGEAPPVIEALEADSQSFKVGDLVYLSSGAVTIVASDQTVFGVALKAGTNVTSGHATIPVQVITPGSLWIAQADTTTATTHVGGKYGLNIGTAGSMSVDIGDTTTTTVRIEALDSRDGAKENGRVLVQFDPAKLQNF